jgi:hypothetical protein
MLRKISVRLNVQNSKHIKVKKKQNGKGGWKNRLRHNTLDPRKYKTQFLPEMLNLKPSRSHHWKLREVPRWKAHLNRHVICRKSHCTSDISKTKRGKSKAIGTTWLRRDGVNLEHTPTFAASDWSVLTTQRRGETHREKESETDGSCDALSAVGDR